MHSTHYFLAFLSGVEILGIINGKKNYIESLLKIIINKNFKILL